MYRHLLVALDTTPLAQRVVDHALALAAVHGARLCFFHARSDRVATGDGALLHTLSPADDARAAGPALALLAKAEAAARAAHQPCTTLAVVSDQPAQAITDAAAAQGCDLIVMASHGRRGLQGLLSGSVTQRVLRAATCPVLVVAVEANGPMDDAQRALAIIRDEHRSLAAVIHGLQRAVQQPQPDFALLRAMLFYVECFPERLHHPKEEAWLFDRLRRRTSESNALIDELLAQHAEGARLFAALAQRLQDWAEGGDRAAFVAALEAFVQAQWRHMAAEEQVVLPTAVQHLQADDWAAIAAAFAANGDPRFDAATGDSFERLNAQLLNWAAGVKPALPGDNA
jgi:nucleotide-binding universal stress UspA family protein/hemerythrin-like domain-containing protein